MGGDGIGPAERRTVAEVLRAGPPTTGGAVELAAAAADAIAALHAVGRAHGRLDADSLLVGEDGGVGVMGALAARVGAAAPVELRSADLLAVGRVLAAALGWPEGVLPAPVEQLVDRAERSAAPASALAAALRRLDHDPVALAALLPPAPRVAAKRPSTAAALLRTVVPSADRRTIALAASAVVAAAGLGTGLLLVGTPGSSGSPPRAAEAAVVAPEPSTAASVPVPAAIEAADPRPSSIRALLRPTRSAVPSREVPRRAPVQVAGPTVEPAPSAAPTTRPATSGSPSSSASAEPTAIPSPPPAPSEPVASPSAPAAPSSAPPAAPAPAATTPPSAAPAPPRVTPVAPAPPAPPARSPRAAAATGSPTAG